MSAIFGGKKSKQQAQNTSVQQSQNSSVNGSENQSTNYNENTAQSTSSGSSSGSSDSRNVALPFLMDTFGGVAQQSGRATDAIANLLGIGGDPAAARTGLSNFQNSAGFRSQMDAGSRAISGNGAARGLLSSGATAKGLTQFGQGLASQFYDKYLNNLLGLSGQGLQAGGLISGAGNVATSQQQSQNESQSTSSGVGYGQSTGSSYGSSQGTSSGSSQGTSSGSSSEKPGLGGLIGTLASKIPSDPRLKTNITQIGNQNATGLGIYSYNYIWDDPAVDPLRVGVMADEVAELVPDALGPLLPGGFMTVDYSKLPPLISKEQI